jgi:hypothetical protein
MIMKITMWRFSTRTSLSRYYSSLIRNRRLSLLIHLPSLKRTLTVKTDNLKLILTLLNTNPLRLKYGNCVRISLPPLMKHIPFKMILHSRLPTFQYHNTPKLSRKYQYSLLSKVMTKQSQHSKFWRIIKIVSKCSWIQLSA